MFLLVVRTAKVSLTSRNSIDYYRCGWDNDCLFCGGGSSLNTLPRRRELFYRSILLYRCSTRRGLYRLREGLHTHGHARTRAAPHFLRLLMVTRNNFPIRPLSPWQHSGWLGYALRHTWYIIWHMPLQQHATEVKKLWEIMRSWFDFRTKFKKNIAEMINWDYCIPGSSGTDSVKHTLPHIRNWTWPKIRI